MRAVQFKEYGDPDVLRVADVPEPHAGPGQIRVAVRGAGVNPVDWKLRSGSLREIIPLALPTVPGSDVAGVVDEVGDGVEGVSVGDEVFGFSVGGAAAEYALLEHYAAKPAGMPWAEAAALPVAVETAERCLRVLDLKSGQTIVVNGAAGGVGVAAVQFARARGARVIGTASERNHDFLRSLGVDPTTYGDGLAERVRRIVADGVDCAFDTAGQGALPALIELTGDPQKVVTIADYTAQQYGVQLSTGAGERAYDALAEAARLHEAGRFTMPIDETFTFELAADAHRLSEGGHVRGKLVLTPS